MDPDEDFVCFGDGLRDVCESQHVWRPVPVVDNCPHRFPFLPSLPFLLAVGCGWRIAPRSVILRPCTRLPDQRQTGRAVSSLVPGWDAPCGLCEDAPSEGRVVRHPAQTTSTRPVGYPGILASWHPGILASWHPREYGALSFRPGDPYAPAGRRSAQGSAASSWAASASSVASPSGLPASWTPNGSPSAP